MHPPTSGVPPDSPDGLGRLVALVAETTIAVLALIRTVRWTR